VTIQRYGSVVLASILILQIGILGITTTSVFAADDSTEFALNQDVSDQHVSFQKAINLSKNNASSVLPQIAVSGNDVYVVWADVRGANGNIIFRASHNNGLSFDSKINLSKDNKVSYNPRLVADGNNVYAVWQVINGTVSDIFFSASNDRGRSFSKAINLSSDNGISVYPLLAATGNNVYVVWQERSGNGEIYFIASNDAGITFGEKINLSDSPTVSENSQIAASRNNVYVAWVEGDENSYQVRFRASNDNGGSFDSTMTLSDPSVDTDKFMIAASGNNVYLVWGSTFGTFFRASNDNGNIFQDAINLSTEYSNLESPRIAVSGNNVHVVWFDESDEKVNIRYRSSNDGGITFSDSIILRKEKFLLASHEIHASGANVYLLWGAFERTSRAYQVFLRASDNNGESFGPVTNLSSGVGSGGSSSIDASGNKVYIVWQSPSPGKKPDIYFSRGNIDPKGTFQLYLTGILEYDNGNRQDIRVNVTGNVSTTGKLLLLKNITGTVELKGTVAIEENELQIDVVNGNGNVNLTDRRLRLDLNDEGAISHNVIMLGVVQGMKLADGYSYVRIQTIRGEIFDDRFKPTLEGWLRLEFVGCFDQPLGKRLSEDNTSSKFDSGLYEKIRDLLKAGETRHYSIIIWVADIGDVKQKKDMLECALINNHGAKDVYKGQALSFVVADVPLEEIPKVAWYRFVDAIGDGEEEFEL